MTSQRNLLVALAIVAVALGTALFYRAHERQPAAAPAQEKILYWYDPMHPQQHFDKPGRSPFMDMDLVPKYARDADTSAAADAAAPLGFDTRSLQKLGLRLATVERGALAAPLGAVGAIAFNERDLTVLQTRSAGFVQRVYDLAVGDVVARGAPLVDLVVPEWLGAQQELLALQASGDGALLAAARARALALGMPAETIAQIERSRQPRTAFTVAAPRAGAIRTLDVRAGMNLAAGAALATINGVDPVWLDVAVPQALAQSIAIGAAVEADFAALPTQRGVVVAILPESDSATRTLRVRAELKNPRGELRPGLLAQVRFAGLRDEPALLVPSAAIIRGGRGDRVIVADGNGGFRAVAVTVGREAAERSEILSGLEAGQQVVASGQFLVDSEANLAGQLERLQGAAPPGPAADAPPVPEADAAPAHEAHEHDHAAESQP